MLQLYNTLTKSKELFQPLVKRDVKIFTCGPSVYQPPHIGNYRTFLYEDMLVRYLRYQGYHVRRAIILTDIEDKAIAEAEKHRLSVKKITNDNAKRFFYEAKALMISLPKEIARSSTTVKEAIAVIQRLLQKGIAYRHGENIYFDVHAFSEFGKLFKIDISSWPKRKVRFSRDTYNGRRWNRGDFILWHGVSEDEEISFDAPFGRGRPSWNVQDPAAVIKYLGEQIDINCGGIDNLYRHHDYNIAVMETSTGKPFARYYLHGEHLLVDGKTMSKSRGNIIYPSDVYRMGLEPRHLRFFLCSKHYRERLNYTEKALKKAAERLDAVRADISYIFKRVKHTASQKGPHGFEKKLLAVFEASMNDDLDFTKTFEAIEKEIKLIAHLNSSGRISAAELMRIRRALHAIDEVLCVLL